MGISQSDYIVYSTPHLSIGFVLIFITADMISPHDSLYQETRQIKLGLKKPAPEYVDIINWAKEELGLSVLNISHQLIRVGKTETRPGFKLILEYPEDYKKVIDPQTDRGRKELQELVRSKIAETIRARGILTYGKAKLDESFISYAIFSKVAVIECLGNINRELLHQIQATYKNQKLNKIIIYQGTVILIVEQEEHVKQNQQNGVFRQIENDIVFLATQHDEFGYIDHSSVSFQYDSKEYIDRQFDGKWYNYFR